MVFFYERCILHCSQRKTKMSQKKQTIQKKKKKKRFLIVPANTMQRKYLLVFI